MERLNPGDPLERVTELLGEPGARCSAGDLSHLAESFPPGWPAASVETTLQTLGTETRERWIYPLDPDDEAPCAPTNEQTELGIAADGRLLWYVAITGESPLRLPGRFTPAAGND